jgi:hypothetical protein
MRSVIPPWPVDGGGVERSGKWMGERKLKEKREEKVSNETRRLILLCFSGSFISTVE